MSIIPIICYNYMAESRRRREEDDNSYREKNNLVYGDRSIHVCLSPEGFSSIAEYREAYHKWQKALEDSDNNEKGGVK